MKKHLFPLVIALSSLGTGAYWYYSPFLSVKNIESAIKDNDQSKFDQQVDYPKLRSNIKIGISESMGIKTDNNPQSLFGGISNKVIENMVELLVKPDFVFGVIKATSSLTDDKKSGNVASHDSAAHKESHKLSERWHSSREGMNKINYHFDQAGLKIRTTITMERYGFATWKITNIAVPKEGFAKK